MRPIIAKRISVTGFHHPEASTHPDSAARPGERSLRLWPRMRLSSSFGFGLAFSWACAVLSASAPGVSAQAESIAHLPPELKPWVGWVMENHPRAGCPDNPVSGDTLCAFIPSLTLDLDARGGTFREAVELLAPSEVALPGQEEAWPEDVRVDGRVAPWMRRNGEALLRLPAGRHVVEGRFRFPPALPSLKLPPSLARLELRWEGKAVLHPKVDGDGRVWFTHRPEAGRAEGGEGGDGGDGGEGKEGAVPAGGRLRPSVDVQVFRRLDDGQPFQTETVVAIRVGGEAREWVGGPALPPGDVVTALSGDLPARVEPDGRLRVQVKPGQWEIRLRSRALRPVQGRARPAIGGERVTRKLPADGAVDVEPPTSGNPGLWPEREIWSFAADGQRPRSVVPVRGGASLDPSQTLMPGDWRSLPAFSMAPGDSLSFTLPEGGAALNPSKFRLSRSVWLDFGGGGATLSDALFGQTVLRERIETQGGYAVGRLELNGEPVSVTVVDSLAGTSSTGKNTASAGVQASATSKDGEAGPGEAQVDKKETRHAGAVRGGFEAPPGSWNLQAVSRFEPAGMQWPIVGWNRDMDAVDWTLNLPPGLGLVHASGPDQVHGSFVSAWSLWEIFLLCLLVLGFFKVSGWRAALLAGALFALGLQERGLTWPLWLNALLALALFKVLPEGRLRRFVGPYRLVSLAVLALMLIPFSIQQARYALYPQLRTEELSFHSAQRSIDPGESADTDARVRKRSGGGGRPEKAPRFEPAPPPMPQEMDALESRAMEEEALAKPASPPPRRALSMKSLRSQPAPMASAVAANQAYGGEAPPPSKIQTGPGVPDWNWDRVSLQWTGPVTRTETLTLWLSPPWLTRLGSLARAALPWALLAMLAGMGLPGSGLGRRTSSAKVTGGGGGKSGLRAGLAAILVPLLVGGGLFGAQQAAGAEFPDASLLRELEKRLLRPAECRPECASAGRARLVLADGEGAESARGLRGLRELRLELELSAVDSVLVPLPDIPAGQATLMGMALDGREALSAQVRGQRLALLPVGSHTLRLTFALARDRVDLTFPWTPTRAEVTAPGWDVQGWDGRRVLGGSLVFLRLNAVGLPGTEGEDKAEGKKDEGAALLPDPVAPFVRVTRSLELRERWTLNTRVQRLAPSEGPLALRLPLLPFERPVSDLRVEGGQAQILMPEGTWSFGWTSDVPTDSTALRLTAGAWESSVETWTLDAGAQWHVDWEGADPAPESQGQGTVVWKPFPGDTLRLAVSRPRAFEGPTRTVESASLHWTPGKREGNATLSMAVRAGQGDEMRLTLPEGWRLESLNTDQGSRHPARREGSIPLTLVPGLQHLTLELKAAEAMRMKLATPAIAVDAPLTNLNLEVQVPSDRWLLWVSGPDLGPALLVWGALAVLLALAFALGRSGWTPLGFGDWSLLALGLCTVRLEAGVLLLLWFLALRWRAAKAESLSRRTHNLVQALLAFGTLVVMGTLLATVPDALLSWPDMWVEGNGSYGSVLRWYQDRVSGAWPTATLVTVPLWVYRLAMLAWSLWLAFRLLKWLRWGWDGFSRGGLWKKAEAKGKPSAP